MSAVSVIARLLEVAMQVESDRAEEIVNFNQTQEPISDHALVRVGQHKVVPDCRGHRGEIELPPQLWQPLVDLSHLNEEQQELVKTMLYEESNVFAQDDNDIGCFPSLQMSVTLKDDIPVQRSYAVVPKPLYYEVKE